MRFRIEPIVLWTTLLAVVIAPLPAVSVPQTLVITPNTAGGVAVGDILACMNPKYMGAVMDGVTDDSVSMQNTINAAAGAGRGCIDVPEGTLRATNLQITNNNIKIICRTPGGGAAGGTTFLAADLTSTVFTISSVSGFYLRDCGFMSASRQTAGAYLDYENSNSDGVDNVRMGGAYDNITVNDSNVIHFNHLAMRNWTHHLVNIGGTVGYGGAADLYFYQVTADEDDNTYSPDAGFYFTQSGGAVTITASDIIHAHNPLWVNPGSGQFVSWIYGTDAFFDSCDFLNAPRGGVGILVTPHGGAIADGGSFSNLWASTCTNSLNITADSSSTATDYQFTNPRFLHDLQDGVVLGKSDNTYIVNPTIAGGSLTTPGNSNAIVLNAGAEHVGIHSGHAGGNFANYTPSFKFGLVLNSGFAGTLLVDGTDLTGNVAGAVYNGATPSTKARVINSPGYNPLGVVSISVGASPFSYQAGLSPESINIFGGTGVVAYLADPNGGATQAVCNQSPCAFALDPGQAAQVTYSTTPSMTVSKH